MTPSEDAFAEELIAYWLSFVRAGDPSTFKLARAPAWPLYTPADPRRVVLTAHSVRHLCDAGTGDGILARHQSDDVLDQVVVEPLDLETLMSAGVQRGEGRTHDCVDYLLGVRGRMLMRWPGQAVGGGRGAGGAEREEVCCAAEGVG